MLEIRPNCENCNCDLPPASKEAHICSYECTFCSECVAKLENVCPNCGGGFEKRPIRVSKQWRKGLSLTQQTPSEKRVLKPVDFTEHKDFSHPIKKLSPEER